MSQNDNAVPAQRKISAAISNAVSHFKAKPIRELPVPEWGITVYAHPINMATKGKWLAMAQGNNSAYLIYAVVYGARDSDGKPHFGLEDLDDLRHRCDPAIVSDIAMFILDMNGSATEEEREKN